MAQRDNGKVLEQDTGRYLYCIADGKEKASFGGIGIGGNEVYTIPYRELCAVVHNCPAQPYRSEDRLVIEDWIKTHQKVVDEAWERFGNVLPFGFDTIIEGRDGASPAETMREWLKQDYENLIAKMDKIRDKAEYGVQISWDPEIIGRRIVQGNEEVKRLTDEMKGATKGKAYFIRERMERLLKVEMESEAGRLSRDFYKRIKVIVDDVHIDKTKKMKDRQMIMNISCLASEDQYKKLGIELEEIANMEGLTVHFTGPWQPYSFI